MTRPSSLPSMAANMRACTACTCFEEVQAVHARMFAAMDGNDDGHVTAEEMERIHARRDGIASQLPKLD